MATLLTSKGCRNEIMNSGKCSEKRYKGLSREETHLLFSPSLAKRRDHFRSYMKGAEAHLSHAFLPLPTFLCIKPAWKEAPNDHSDFHFHFAQGLGGRGCTTLHCPGRVTSGNSYLGIGREMPPAGHSSCGNKPRGRSGSFRDRGLTKLH